MATLVTMARVLFTFQGQQAGDLSLTEGEVIKILEKNDSGWWTGQNDAGKKGEFPYNYVEEIAPQDERQIRAASQFIEPGQGRMESISTDEIHSVTVAPEDGDGSHRFKVCVKLPRKNIESVKEMEDFRRLDELLKFMYPSFDRALPPHWADKISESAFMNRKKAKLLQGYLQKMLINTKSGNQITEFALVSWLSPRESFGCEAEIKRQVQEAAQQASRRNGGRNEVVQAQLEGLMLARAEFAWVQQDVVELPLELGSFVSVRNTQTLNEGWWECEDVTGQRGITPNNYLKVLSKPEAALAIKGSAKKKASTKLQSSAKNNHQQMSAQFSQFYESQKNIPQQQQQSKSKTQGVSSGRERKIEDNFAIPNLDAFDELLNDGFTMVEKDQIVTKRKGAAVPQKGDTVQLSYVAYVWDCQNQKLLEFASSDLPDSQKQVGPMVFTVGQGGTIKALQKAVVNLEKGQQSRVIVTPDLGYGEAGSPPSVPPNCHLIYDVTLDSFESGGGGIQAASKPNNYVTNRPKRSANPHRTENANNMSFDNSNNGNGNGKKRYDLKTLRQIVQHSAFQENGVNQHFVEDHLTDDAFERAFKMSRTDFMLMQKWKRSKLKQDAGLF